MKIIAKLLFLGTLLLSLWLLVNSAFSAVMGGNLMFILIPLISLLLSIKGFKILENDEHRIGLALVVGFVIPGIILMFLIPMFGN
ncbi:hypothetical protein H7Y21_02550 [Arenimonas sp.]|nr:hypothetical protein [Candidatus Parcubacteria bacterium]